MRMILAATAGLLAFAPAALSQGVPLPAYDVDAACRRGMMAEAVAHCINMVQSSYDLLRLTWPRAGDDLRRRCTTGWGGPEYIRYEQISACVLRGLENERFESEKRNPPKFRY